MLLAVSLLSLVPAGASSRKAKGGAIGAAAGGAVGGFIGRKNGGTSRGALIGAVIGGTAGAIIGHRMDQQAKELAPDIPGATVERVGEGIQVTFAPGLLYDCSTDAIRTDGRRESP